MTRKGRSNSRYTASPTCAVCAVWQTERHTRFKYSDSMRKCRLSAVAAAVRTMNPAPGSRSLSVSFNRRSRCAGSVILREIPKKPVRGR